MPISNIDNKEKPFIWPLNVVSRHVNRERGEGYGGVIGITYSVYTQKRMLKLHIMINKSVVSCVELMNMRACFGFLSRPSYHWAHLACFTCPPWLSS
jgi:hypothetical protein